MLKEQHQMICKYNRGGYGNSLVLQGLDTVMGIEKTMHKRLQKHLKDSLNQFLKENIKLKRENSLLIGYKDLCEELGKKLKHDKK